MKAKIEIDCETTDELVGHLLLIIDTVKVRSRGDNKHKFDVGTQFKNVTRFGNHKVEIIPDNFKVNNNY